MAVKPARIRVYIDRLVLEDLPLDQFQGKVVKASVEAELVRLLAEGGLNQGLAAGGAVPSVPTGNIELDGGGPAQVGRQIARAVYRGVGK